MKEDKLRAAVYRYKDEISYFSHNHAISVSPEEKMHCLQLMEEKTESLLRYIEDTFLNSQQTDTDNAEMRVFTLEELAYYDGTDGKPAYVAVNGVVYDMSSKAPWAGGMHFGLNAGRDLTQEFRGCHLGSSAILNSLVRVGVMAE